MPERFDGYVTVLREAPLGMVTLRGDLGAARLRAAVQAATGCEVPPVRGIAEAAGRDLAWMSPDELLLLCPHDAARGLAAQLGLALAGLHHLVAEVSDARTGFRLEGAAVREVLAKLTPADVARLPVGEIRRSRLGQVAAAFWLTGEDAARVIAFRSVADYVFTLLCHAARPGSEVG